MPFADWAGVVLSIWGREVVSEWLPLSWVSPQQQPRSGNSESRLGLSRRADNTIEKLEIAITPRQQTQGGSEMASWAKRTRGRVWCVGVRTTSWSGCPQKARGDRKKKMGGFLKETWTVVDLKKGIKLCLLKAGTTCLSSEQTPLFKIKSRNLYLIKKKKKKTFVSKLLKEEKEVRLFFSLFFPPSKYLDQNNSKVCCC